VAPPHTAASLKRCLAGFEDIRDATTGDIFPTLFNPSRMRNAQQATILSPTGLGSMPQEPLALVVSLKGWEWYELKDRKSVKATRPLKGVSLSTRYRSSVVSISFTFPSFFLQRLTSVYYRLYTKGCEVPSKMPINAEEPSLARIRADSVAPPHTVESVKRCISAVERNLAARYGDLYANISCDTPMNKFSMPILTGNVPGLSQDEPMALVYEEGKGVYSRKIKMNKISECEIIFNIAQRVAYSHL
jgi:hypothetical protein